MSTEIEEKIVKEIEIEDSRPDLPLRRSIFTERDYIRMNMWRKMYEMGLETLIFACADFDEIFKEGHGLKRDDLIKEHERSQLDFEKIWSASYYSKDRPATTNPEEAESLVVSYKNKLREFLLMLEKEMK